MGRDRRVERVARLAQPRRRRWRLPDPYRGRRPCCRLGVGSWGRTIVARSVADPALIARAAIRIANDSPGAGLGAMQATWRDLPLVVVRHLPLVVFTRHDREVVARQGIDDLRGPGEGSRWRSRLWACEFDGIPIRSEEAGRAGLEG